MQVAARRMRFVALVAIMFAACEPPRLDEKIAFGDGGTVAGKFIGDPTNVRVGVFWPNDFYPPPSLPFFEGYPFEQSSFDGYCSGQLVGASLRFNWVESQSVAVNADGSFSMRLVLDPSEGRLLKGHGGEGPVVTGYMHPGFVGAYVDTNGDGVRQDGQRRTKVEKMIATSVDGDAAFLFYSFGEQAIKGFPSGITVQQFASSALSLHGEATSHPVDQFNFDLHLADADKDLGFSAERSCTVDSRRWNYSATEPPTATRVCTADGRSYGWRWRTPSTTSDPCNYEEAAGAVCLPLEATPPAGWPCK